MVRKRHRTTNGVFDIGQCILSTVVPKGLEHPHRSRSRKGNRETTNGSPYELVCRDFFIGKWDHDTGGRRLENRIQRGEAIADAHLRAWRVSREEITINIIRWVRLVINNHNAVNSRQVELDSLFLEEFPESLWGNIERFLLTLSQLPCWTNPELSSSVFGPKQNLDYWESIFKTGKSTSNTLVLAQPLNLQDMIAQP